MQRELLAPVVLTIGSAYFLIQMRRFGPPLVRLGYESGVWINRLAAASMGLVAAFGLLEDGWDPTIVFVSSMMFWMALFSAIPVELRPKGITSGGNRLSWERVVRYSWTEVGAGDQQLLLAIQGWRGRERTMRVSVPPAYRRRATEVLASYVHPQAETHVRSGEPV